MASVKLPERSNSVREATERTPVWTLDSGAVNYGTNGTPSAGAARTADEAALVQPPLKALCDTHNRPDAVCCRTLKGDDERNLLDPDVVKDIIIGLSDGLTVPFGLTAGLAALGNSRVVVVGGIAELISGAISMGVGGALSAQAERDHYRYLKRTTRARVKRSCAGELEREVTEVLGCVGLEESLCRRVAVGLMKVETEVGSQNGSSTTTKAKRDSFVHKCLRAIARTPRTKLDDSDNDEESSQQSLRFSDEVGLTPFLLKFGEGLEEVPTSRIFISAFTIGIAYAVGGLFPLLPYFFIPEVRKALFWSIGLTAFILVIFGILKAYHTGGKIGFSGYFQNALSTLLVGGVAAGSAFAICAALEA